MSNRISYILIALFISGVSFYTGNKIIKMLKIREILPGAVVSEKTITDKWSSEKGTFNDGNDVFWIAWDNADIRQKGNMRINLSKEIWNNLSVGDNIRITRIKNDPDPYYKNGVFASTGNIVFDLILFFFEVSGSVFLIMKAVLQKKTDRA